MLIRARLRYHFSVIEAHTLQHLTNVRSVQKDEFYKLTPPKRMTLEEYMAYMRDDELLEITPKSIRLRKVILNPSLRPKKKAS